MIAPKIAAPTETGPAIAVLENGARVRILREGRRSLVEAEAVLSEKSFARLSSVAATKEDRQVLIRSELDRAIQQLTRQGARVLYRADEIGYFAFALPFELGSADLLAGVRKIRLESTLLINPIHFDLDSLASVKTLSTELLSDAGLSQAPPRETNDGFSGLDTVGATEFEALVESELGNGVQINGSSVRLGITDTGITLNHPTFRSHRADHVDASRIVYLKDFTQEGRVYFHPDALLSIKTGSSDEELLISGEVIQTPRLPSLPVGDQRTQVKDLKLRVSSTLKAELSDPIRARNFRLGFLAEDSLNGEEDLVDINANGSRTDRFPILYAQGESPSDDRFYIDFTGEGDFRAAPALHDWNRSRETVTVGAERIGFEAKADQLAVSVEGQPPISVRSLSIVGYDPGNHGSHVAGIAAGAQTLSNDLANTRARGVAPEAAILMNRVCANNTGCQATAALIDLVLVGHADVVNMSLGGLSPFNDGYGTQETAINRLTAAKGALFMISAGNSGPGKQTVGSPSTARLALSVGASATTAMIQRQYQYPGLGGSEGSGMNDPFMLFFSSRGPSAGGGFKPNLTAPGTELSSIQLHAASGRLAGLDVYWGTSMAAPAATGAYALLLDGINKFNTAHPESPLPTHSTILRRVLIESAQPFDVSRTDLSTGNTQTGQYTWTDQGTGMIHLPSAWTLLKKWRAEEPEATVKLTNGAPVELDYEVLVNSKDSPSRSGYDGSRLTTDKTPIFGSGVYLDFFGGDTLRKVAIARKIPEGLATGEEDGALLRQIASTSETFTLRTVIYGSSIPWIKAGVLDQLAEGNCEAADSAPLTLIGQTATTSVDDAGKGVLTAARHSSLNLCMDREAIETRLAPGDHGALIYAYRTRDGKTSPIASFVVPVSISVPHRSLELSQGYEFAAGVKSFGVRRHYVNVPAGTTVLRVKLEVPPAKLATGNRRLAAGERCSGIELMELEGANTANPFAKDRAQARVSNCKPDGTPELDARKRTLLVTRVNPRAGLWDLHVFGQYAYRESDYRISVDYLRANSEISLISGDVAALTGSFDWKVEESSLHVGPSAEKSLFEILGFHSSTTQKVAAEQDLIVDGALGKFRKYPQGTKSVEVTTGGSTGNDIDLRIYECPGDQTAFDPHICTTVAESGGSTDVESGTFEPATDKVYVVSVRGYEISAHEGEFTSIERIRMAPERGTVAVTGVEPLFRVSYAFDDAALTESRVLNHELFGSGKCGAFGRLQLLSADQITLGEIPVSIRKGPPHVNGSPN